MHANRTPSVLSKFHVGLLIMSLTISSLMLMIYFRMSYINKLRQDVLQHFYDENEEQAISYDDYMQAKFGATIEQIDNILYMKNKINKINGDQVIHNKHRFGSVKPTTYIIVIQVHDEIRYLKELVQSLKYTMGITNSLLIFSHDFYDEEINKFINNITFAKYTQIFYPYSTQIYPNAFPGLDHNLCLKDFECEKSFLRVESLAQKKHFWWWQTNHIFDHLREIENYDSTIVFLEENQFVLSDFIFMLKVLESMMANACPKCEIISLGAHRPALKQFHVKDGNLTISSWNYSILNIGIAFNRTVWNSIREYSYHFCHFNDHRWDVSLKYLATKRPQGHFMVLSSDAPRVIQYKKCNSYACTIENSIEDVKQFARTIHRGLYPRNVNIKTLDESDFSVTGTGEWEDVRDHGLCMYFVKS